MTIHFGARFVGAENHPVKIPRNTPQVALEKALDEFVADPVVAKALQDASDELVLSYEDVVGHPSDTTFMIRVDRPAHQLAKLPAILRTPHSVVPMHAGLLLGSGTQAEVAAAKHYVSRDILLLDEYLKAVQTDRSQSADGSAAVPETGFARVAGMKDLKETLQSNIIDILQDPEISAEYDEEIPNGFLLYGPPGCGKTFIVERLAEELNCSFKKLDMGGVGSTLIHDTATKISEFYDNAVQEGPCVVFIDEADMFLAARDKMGGYEQYKKDEINTLLQKMNDAAAKGVITIMATNLPQQLDAAGTRTGRSDKHIYVGAPDAEAREEALRMGFKKAKHVNDLDYQALAQETSGFSFSDLTFLTQEAKRRAATETRKRIKEGDETRVKITMPLLHKILATIQPSVPPEKEKEYKRFDSRGVDQTVRPEKVMGFGIREA